MYLRPSLMALENICEGGSDLAYIILLLVSAPGAVLVHKTVLELSDDGERAVRKNKIVIGAILFVTMSLLYHELGWGAQLIFNIYLLLILVCMSIIDFDTGIIPDELVLAGLGGGIMLFFLNLIWPCKFAYERTWLDPVWGLLTGSGTLILIMLLGMLIYRSDEVMGMGDIKIFAPIGMILGFKLTVMALFFSVMAGGAISIVLIGLKIKKRRDTIPFGPFIALGAFLAMLLGNRLWDWYFMFL